MIAQKHIETGDATSPESGVIDLTAESTDGVAATAVSEPTLRLVEDPQPLVMQEPSATCRYRSRRLLAKRIFDRSFGVLAFALALPILAIAALAVRVTSRGPILFAQKRVGRGGRQFTIYKFRTMRGDAEAYLQAHPELFSEHRDNDFRLPTAEDVRVTRLGRLLRSTSLDELPQLINIVKGDMSFVGPRPVVPDELGEYGAHRLMYEAAYPGLTGAWQVSGRDSMKYPARAELDAAYVEGWTFWGDMAIILRTIPAVLLSERSTQARAGQGGHRNRNHRSSRGASPSADQSFTPKRGSSYRWLRAQTVSGKAARTKSNPASRTASIVVASRPPNGYEKLSTDRPTTDSR